MRIAVVHNEYGVFSGEEAVVGQQIKLLRDNGFEVGTFIRSSRNLRGLSGKIKGLLCGLYNPFAKKKFRLFLREFKPDVVHIHNLYPLIGPCVLSECRKAGIPVVMTLHNYRLVCPDGLLFHHGKICTECPQYGVRKCIANRCENSFFKSFGYAWRCRLAARRRWYLDNVSVYTAMTDFQISLIRKLLKTPDLPCRKVPNPVFDQTRDPAAKKNGDYVAFAGRVCEEKGVNVLLAAARKLPDINFQIAGTIRWDDLDSIPENVRLLGSVPPDKMAEFWRGSRLAVMPSIWYETFGMSGAEAMLQEKLLLVSRIAGLPELLPESLRESCSFESGNADQLAELIKFWWENPEKCHENGIRCREYVRKMFSPEKYISELTAIYRELCPGK